jgi:CDP-diacylglycerol--glycerol-3-phosphate 3-phosphatidyltransferase
MNLANKLTFARMCITPFFIVCLEIGGFFFNVLSLFFFVAASMTDFFDGRIARKNKIVTTFGVFLDPLADKLLISAAFICFISIEYVGVPSWLVIIIIAREFLITGLRSIAANKNTVIPADKFGKFKTTSQVIAVVLIISILIVNSYFAEFSNTFGFSKEKIILFLNFLNEIPFWAIALVSLITVYSGINYMLKNKQLLEEK